MSKYRIIILTFGVIFFSACHKNIDNPINSNNPINFSEVFDEFWNQMNANYVYWDIDTTNWDNVYKIYKPIFQNLNLNDENDIKKSVNYFRQMTKGLIDCHYSINFLNSIIKDSFVFPAQERKIITPSFHSPFLYLSIDSNYLDKGFTYGQYINSSNQQIYAISGTINNKTLYFSCNEFSLQEAYISNTYNGVKVVLQKFFSIIQNKPTNIKGLIIDLRNNEGGNIADLNFFLGNFIAQPLQFGYSKYKNGIGKYNYTPWISSILQPAVNAKSLNIPIIVLADNYTISLGEAATMVIKVIRNSIFIGETTWGAIGPIASSEIYNDGQFKVGNFLSVFTSSAQFKYIDNKIYEGKGFPPDINVPFNLSALQNGKDSVLEKAVSIIQ